MDPILQIKKGVPETLMFILFPVQRLIAVLCGLSHGGFCTQRHPTKFGKCLRCGAKVTRWRSTVGPAVIIPALSLKASQTEKERARRGQLVVTPTQEGKPITLSGWNMKEHSKQEYPECDPKMKMTMKRAPLRSAADLPPRIPTLAYPSHTDTKSKAALLSAKDAKPFTLILDTGASH
eukprot:5701099-Amphidinium_carterae.1